MKSRMKAAVLRRRWAILSTLSSLILLMGQAASAQTKKPQYGGQLNIGTVFVGLPTEAWDPADFNWKNPLDTGLVYEQLFAADLNKAKRKGGHHAFYADGWLSPDAIRGELAQTWQWKDKPKRIEIKLRQGVMFPEKPGVMPAREITADDVVFSYKRLEQSPKKIKGYFDHIENVEATDKYTVVFTFKQPNAEWDYRFGWGYYSAIVPPEVDRAGAGNWKNVNGTGPFLLEDYVKASAYTFVKNPNYWDREIYGGSAYKLPFVDKIVYPVIRDEAAQIAALREAKLDILELVRWSFVDELKRKAPKLRWSRWLSMNTSILSLRMDTKPFDDIRVRRALNMAVNKQEIIKYYFGGHGTMLAFPIHPDQVGYYEPLDQMPSSIRQLFTYDPDRAKELLAEAGYPDGFTFKVQIASASIERDLLELVSAYLEQVGVHMEIEVMEYGPFFAAMVNGTTAPGYFVSMGSTNPTTVLRKTFVKGQQWNTAHFHESRFERKLNATIVERDPAKRMAMIRSLTRDVLDKAPFIWLPTQYAFTAWWPWVQNYGGELRAGANRPGPIHARIWVDHELKQKLGYGPPSGSAPSAKAADAGAPKAGAASAASASGSSAAKSAR